MDPDEAYKNKIGERLTGILLDALENGEVSEEESSDISSYILDHINKAKDNASLFDFLTTLSKTWPIFSKALTMENEEILNNKKNEAIGQASSLIQENKIDEAIKIVENATDQNIGGV